MSILKILLSLTVIFICTKNIAIGQENPPEKETDLPFYIGSYDFSLEVRPETIYFGDPVYFVIKVKNDFSKPMYVQQWNLSDYSNTLYSRIEVEANGEKLDIAAEMIHYAVLEVHRPWPTILAPDKELLNSADALCFPPLEDIYDPFWTKIRETPLAEGKSIVFSVGLFPETESKKATIHIKPRAENEWALVERWYKNTPKVFFPTFKEMRSRGYKGSLFKKYPQGEFQRKESDTNKILGVSPWTFVSTGNRYPSDPNAPETWQGWKELEETLTPSTMRDEIRLTRICIQYCDTKDEAVLKELKEWFDTMNEVQRICMSKSLRDRAVDCYGNDELLTPFREIYKTIRQYDLVHISEFGKKHLKDLGLAEEKENH